MKLEVKPSQLSKRWREGGEKVLCIGTAARPQPQSAIKDRHFTVFWFIAAKGTSAMCAIIFAAKEVELNWVQWLNSFVEWNGNENDFKLNIGKWKQYSNKCKTCALFVLLFVTRKHCCFSNAMKIPRTRLLLLSYYIFPIASVLCPVTPEVIIVSYMCHSLFAVSIHFDAINACQY